MSKNTRDELIATFSLPTEVLDHGMVRLVDVMGNDAAVVQAARVSYGEGTRAISEDRSLIRYLLRHQHMSPFEMCEVKFHCKMPIFVARQWIRHRTANVNEVSGRYSVLPDEMYVPDRSAIALQSESNKQGRADRLADSTNAEGFLDMLERSQKSARDSYEWSLGANVAKELARINLPVSQYTEWYWKIDLRNLLHFLHLRLDSHAQYEIRVYAEAIAKIVQAWVPYCWEAFVDYVRDAVVLTKPEIELIRQQQATNRGAFDPAFKHRLSKRELQEFTTKLALLGFDPYDDFGIVPPG
jgi:thymidylate synthase (FAD)